MKSRLVQLRRPQLAGVGGEGRECPPGTEQERGSLIPRLPTRGPELVGGAFWDCERLFRLVFVRRILLRLKRACTLLPEA